MFVRMNIDPTGVFLMRVDLLGATEDEIVAQERAELPQQRVDELTLALRMAAGALARRIPEGLC